ncbi:MAG: hypothetical protein ILP09_02020 [Oscillospiraceae bacterium]|nr:hypothetical protein [Oscillospiraceae bacterium]
MRYSAASSARARPRRFTATCTDIAVILNVNAACPAAVLDGVITEAVNSASRLYRLDTSIFKKECFNMGEQPCLPSCGVLRNLIRSHRSRS